MNCPDTGVRPQLRAVLEQYLCALDFHDYGSLADCFTPDAALTYDVRPYRFVGGRALAEWVQTAHRRHGALSAHVLSSVTIAEATQRATARSLVVANLARPAESGYAVTVRGIRYDDEFAETEDGWRISRRTHRPLWQFEARGPRLADIGAAPEIGGSRSS